MKAKVWLLAAVCAALLLGGVADSAAAVPRPNIVIFLADDMDSPATFP